MNRSAILITAGALAVASLVPALQANAARTPPVGSYQQSCGQAALSNSGILSANCRAINGAFVPASLNMADCGPGDIQNRDGQLACQPSYGPGSPGDRPGRGPGRGKAPGKGHGGPERGGYGPASLTLYEAANYQGRSLEIRGDIDSLNYGHFNDITSSIRVNGGEWQICAAGQYGKPCVVIRRDVPNLSRYNLNDQLSSVKRVG